MRVGQSQMDLFTGGKNESRSGSDGLIYRREEGEI